MPFDTKLIFALGEVLKQGFFGKLLIKKTGIGDNTKTFNSSDVCTQLEWKKTGQYAFVI